MRPVLARNWSFGETKPCYLQQNKEEAETKTDSRVCHSVNLLPSQFFLCDADCFRKVKKSKNLKVLAF
jgi:hypothetical protein